MKLGDYFTELEDIACGPYLTAFKKLFSKQELDAYTVAGTKKKRHIWIFIRKL